MRQGEVKRVAFHIKPLVGLSGFRRRHRQSRPRLEVVSKPVGHATTTITEHTYAELLDDTTRRELLHILKQSPEGFQNAGSAYCSAVALSSLAAPFTGSTVHRFTRAREYQIARGLATEWLPAQIKVLLLPPSLARDGNIGACSFRSPISPSRLC
jgi:hypothetical protein